MSDCEEIQILPFGQTIDKKYPYDIDTLDKIIKENKMSLKEQIITSDDVRLESPKNVVMQILDKKKKKDEIVVPHSRFQSLQNIILFKRSEIGLSVLDDVPKTWQRNDRIVGYANDDLVNAYMILMSRLNAKISFRTQQDLDVIIHKLEVGKKRSYVNGIAKYQFQTRRALFEKKNDVIWKETDDKPSVVKLHRTIVSKDIRSKLLSGQLKFKKEEIERFSLPETGYIEIMTQTGLSRFFSIVQKLPTPIYDRVIFPVHKNDHWALICIDFTRFTIEHFDSLYKPLNMKTFIELKKYIKSALDCVSTSGSENMKVKYMRKFYQIDYSKVSPHVTPRQTGVDCGFFIMEMAKYLCLGWKITAKHPSSKDMEHIRKRCVYELHQQCLLKI